MPSFTNTGFLFFTIQRVYRSNQKYNSFSLIILIAYWRKTVPDGHFYFPGIYGSIRRKLSKNSFFRSSLPTENRLVGEEGGVGFKETPPWFKTKRYFFVLKRCIFHVVSCKEWFFFVYYCIYLCRFFSSSLFLEWPFFNVILKIAHSSDISGFRKEKEV